jgi:hypothetical protein
LAGGAGISAMTALTKSRILFAMVKIMDKTFLCVILLNSFEEAYVLFCPVLKPLYIKKCPYQGQSSI